MSFGGSGSDVCRDHFSLPLAEHAVYKKVKINIMG